MMILGIIIGTVTIGFVILMFLLFLIGGLIKHKKTRKPFTCCLGYHRPIGRIDFDGCSLICSCKKCGSKLLQDSQGNWFDVD